MAELDLQAKLAILADAAKYDASCASSGSGGRKGNRDRAATGSDGMKGLGSTTGMGICHAYTPDGRCVSLLKILLTNVCIFDCSYCINRRSSSVRRARFTVAEVVELTLRFYQRNYIEGLFLSSGIIRSPDYTMEQLVEVARRLREDHDFRGYIHLKTIPDADPRLIEAAGRHADRLSINIELPTEDGLKRLAPEKQVPVIRGAMDGIKGHIDERKDARRRFRHAPRFAPAGQSTQLIVGADGADDSAILSTAHGLYGRHAMRRVYYSAFSPIQDASSLLPTQRPPLEREHRLYQADWLLRFYGFSLDEITGSLDGGMLDLSRDPKLAWALRNRAQFPLDLNRAPREQLLRVPGLGVKVVDRILAARRFQRLRLADIARMTRTVDRLKPFIVTLDWRPVALADRAEIAPLLPARTRKLDLFAA